MSLEIQSISISAGGFSLSNLSLIIPQGECAVIMGKSGMGKTTLMEAICGLRSVDEGSIILAGNKIEQLRPGERGIGLVPQDSALFSHMTVREHIEFPLKLQKWSQVDVKDRVNDLSLSLGLESLLERKPARLSGGEKKRVAIGRAIAARPRLLCLDEAFTGLDDESSLAIISQLKEMICEESITTINITHRIEEAKLIGDELYQLNKEGLAQVKT